MNPSTRKRNDYIRGYELPTATKTPPQIAPGIICPKCKGAMLDERLTKRTDKSPDYTCANMLCTDPTGKYRTAIWAEKTSNGATGGEGNAGNPTSAPPAEPAPKKPTMREAYRSLTIWVMEEIAPLYAEEEWGMTAADVAACTATLFIQACKSGKVE